LSQMGFLTVLFYTILKINPNFDLSILIKTTMGIFKPIFVILLASSLFSSCSNDVDIYADYKDITVVYGLLDSSDDTTWLKVTKAFSGPGNAIVFAQDPDSSNYSYKLDVKIKGIENGIEKQTIVFDTITIKNKKPGDSVFYFPNQLVYYTTQALDADYKYTLTINKQQENLTAETGLVNDFTISYPNRYINFMSDKDIEWYSGKNGKRYEASLVFHYKELLAGSSDTTYGSVGWYLGMRKSNTLDGGEDMYIGYLGNAFYSTLENQLDKPLNVKRWAGNVDVVIASASQVFDTYIEVNEGNDNLLSEVPVYTNIEGGYGIFASRRTIIKEVGLSVQTELKLISEYPDLGFQPKQ